jgi:glutamyl-tRNA reductase
MHRRFKVLSISHKTAPIAIREQMALNSQETVELLKQIQELFSLRDVLVLSTCNRTEIYYASEKDLSQELVKILALQKGIIKSTKYIGYFKSLTNHHKAVEHLFRVGTGLESQIVGDMQITNQVKTAYQLTADEDMVGPFLHRLLHTVFFTNKKVVQETAFRDGAASVSYATLELVAELTIKQENPTIMIVGLGDVGSDLCLNIADHRNFQHFNVLVANRTSEKAEKLAETCGFEAIAFDSINEHLSRADVVVTAINSPHLVIKKQQISEQPVNDFKCFIDLSVPRSVEQGIEEINGVLLYNIDNIQTRAEGALQKRLDSIPKVEKLVAEAITDFNDWSKDMSVNPTINKLKNALEQIRKEEIARHLKDTTGDEALMAEKLTKSIMQKVMKLPVLQLKAACRRGDAETLIDVLNNLFNLEKEPLSTNNK